MKIHLTMRALQQIVLVSCLLSGSIVEESISQELNDHYMTNYEFTLDKEQLQLENAHTYAEQASADHDVEDFDDVSTQFSAGSTTTEAGQDENIELITDSSAHTACVVLDIINGIIRQCCELGPNQ